MGCCMSQSHTGTQIRATSGGDARIRFSSLSTASKSRSMSSSTWMKKGGWQRSCICCNADDMGATWSMITTGRQTVCRPVVIIDHVAPMSSALQQMHERCQPPFFIQVDEDMLLDFDAVERLENLIRASPPDVALICVPVWDCDMQQPIHGLKIYRHEIVRRFPYEDRLSCELRQIEQIKAAGYTVSIFPLTSRSDCFGVHGEHY